MEYKLAVIPGDGIGPDVVEQTLLVLDKVERDSGHTFHYQKVLAGGCAIDATGACLPQETIDVCKASDAVLLGAVGGWKWDTLPGDQRPERALLGLRKALGLFANLRPALLFEQLADASPLKPEILAGGWTLWWYGSSPAASTSAKRALRTPTWALPPTTWSSTPRRRSAASPRWPSTWP